MKKKETFLIAGFLSVLAIAIVGGHFGNNHDVHQNLTANEYGNFLAAQHAVYVNDFDSAATFVDGLDNIDYSDVRNVRILSSFLSGKMPDNILSLKDDKNIASGLIYDAYLVQNDRWSELFKRHESDKSGLMSSFRIWGGMAQNYKTKTLKYIDELPVADSWKQFIKGQILAEQGDIQNAAKQFESVPVSFMNINDYLYIMSFYIHNNMTDVADKLRTSFIATPGGMYMEMFDTVPDWSAYAGYKNQLAFNLLQTVSHTKMMMYSDVSVLFLRFAQIIAPESSVDATNYYLGQFFGSAHGNFENVVGNIGKESPFYPFVKLQYADNDIKKLKRVLRAYPLFVPALQQVLSSQIQQGDKRGALRTINNALRVDGLSDVALAFLTKFRANTYYVFGDYENAQSDLHDASWTLKNDSEIAMLQAKIWASENRDIDTAYDYAMSVVRQKPTDTYAWDTLGYVVYVREGVDAALEIVERVASVSNNCSSLFGHLGDYYFEIGEDKLARDAYLRAIDLSDDGLVVVPQINKKLRKLK